MDKLEFNLYIGSEVGMCLPFVTKLVGWEEIYGLGTSFKFVLVWHRTCEKIEATQQTEYSGG
jgi:hypothetical protein